MLALGVIIVSRSASFSGSLVGILFGDALGSRTSDLVLLGIIAAVSLGVSILLYRPFLALSFNEAKAELLGLRPRMAHFAMLTMITLAIVGSFQTVGTLLVFGLLVAPPATAALLVRRVPAMMVASAADSGLVRSWWVWSSAITSVLPARRRWRWWLSPSSSSYWDGRLSPEERRDVTDSIDAQAPAPNRRTGTAP